MKKKILLQNIFPPKSQFKIYLLDAEWCDRKIYFQERKFSRQHDMWYMRIELNREEPSTPTKVQKKLEFGYKPFPVIMSPCTGDNFINSMIFKMEQMRAQKSPCGTCWMWGLRAKITTRILPSVCIFEYLNICIHFYSVLQTVSQYLNCRK